VKLAGEKGERKEVPRKKGLFFRVLCREKAKSKKIPRKVVPKWLPFYGGFCVNLEFAL
jgi:hypothetical protein